MAALRLYTKLDCPSCTQAKKMLNFLQVAYEECRVDQEEEYRSRVVALGFRSLPIAEVEGVGAVLASDRPKLEQFLLQAQLV